MLRIVLRAVGHSQSKHLLESEPKNPASVGLGERDNCGSSPSWS
jgi:hypothetical protein